MLQCYTVYVEALQFPQITSNKHIILVYKMLAGKAVPHLDYVQSRCVSTDGRNLTSY